MAGRVPGGGSLLRPAPCSKEKRQRRDQREWVKFRGNGEGLETRVSFFLKRRAFGDCWRRCLLGLGESTMASPGLSRSRGVIGS